MVRVGSIYDQMLLDNTIKENKTQMVASEQLEHIFKHTKNLLKNEKYDVYEELMKEIKTQGVELISFKEISDEDAAYLEKYFYSTVMPLFHHRWWERNSRSRSLITGKYMLWLFLAQKVMKSYVLCLAAMECLTDWYRFHQAKINICWWKN